MKVFIGCSSKEKVDNIYINSAKTLAKKLVEKNYDLVIGGTDGIMKILHDTFLKEKRAVTILGVTNYFNVSSPSKNIYTYDSIAKRKQAITKLADVVIFLPGGIGTIDEMFTTIESKRANEHNKEIIIININNYYDNLINQLDTMYKNSFADYNNQKYYTIFNNIEDVIKYIN